MSDILFLKNSEIDRKKWSNTLANCPNRHVFAEADFLDVVSPDWAALVRKDYDEIFPLPVKKFFGLKYLVQPEFTAQLGLFSNQKNGQNTDDFIKAIQQKYRRFDFCLNTQNVLPNRPANPLVNCELQLNKSYEELYSSFSKGTKRNIKKAEKTEGFEIKEISFEEYFPFKMQSIAGKPPADYEKLKQLNKVFLNLKIPVRILSFFYKNELIASAMLVEYFDRIYYFNGASTAEGKQFSAMFGVFNFLIKNEAGKGKILDFKGGQMPGTGRFFKGFGAEEKQYFRLIRKF